jgi:hypothetical protein
LRRGPEDQDFRSLRVKGQSMPVKKCSAYHHSSARRQRRVGLGRVCLERASPQWRDRPAVLPVALQVNAEPVPILENVTTASAYCPQPTIAA